MSFENPIGDPVNTETPEMKRELSQKAIRESGLNVNDLFLRGVGENGVYINPESIKAGTYNEQNGVILANIAGEIIALPSNERTHKIIEDSELLLDESVGVPNINNAEVWGDASQRAQSPSYMRWLELNRGY